MHGVDSLSLGQTFREKAVRLATESASIVDLINTNFALRITETLPLSAYAQAGWSSRPALGRQFA